MSTFESNSVEYHLELSHHDSTLLQCNQLLIFHNNHSPVETPGQRHKSLKVKLSTFKSFLEV